MQGLEVGPDVVPHIDVGDVDRQDLVSGAGIKSLLEHALGDRIGLFQYLQVRLGRADRIDDSFTHPGDDRFVGRPADQPVEVGPHRHFRLDLELNPVLGDPIDRVATRARIGAGDHLGIDARLHGLKHVAAGQVDGCGPLVRERNIGPVGGDQRSHHVGHVAAGQVMSLERHGSSSRLSLKAPPGTP